MKPIASPVKYTLAGLLFKSGHHHHHQQQTEGFPAGPEEYKRSLLLDFDDDDDEDNNIIINNNNNGQESSDGDGSVVNNDSLRGDGRLPTVSPFGEFFVATFYIFDREWKTADAQYMDFPKISVATQKKMEQFIEKVGSLAEVVEFNSKNNYFCLQQQQQK